VIEVIPEDWNASVPIVDTLLGVLKDIDTILVVFANALLPIPVTSVPISTCIILTLVYPEGKSALVS